MKSIFKIITKKTENEKCVNINIVYVIVYIILFNKMWVRYNIHIYIIFFIFIFYIYIYIYILFYYII